MGGARAVSQDQQTKLVMRPFLEEVRVVIKGLNAEGALGPDGLPVYLYSEFWGLVRSNMMVMLEEFQHGTEDMTKTNRSHLFLLPKRHEADLIVQLNISHNCKGIGELIVGNNLQASGTFPIKIHTGKAASRLCSCTV